jgi:hypothetical protein
LANRRGIKLSCLNRHRKNDTEETRWPSPSKLIDRLLADYTKPEDITPKKAH